ncbi:MAG: alpha/beta fold hydrolase [Alphaproteobacteria bacterium]|nr:alpha/beta fold hydrolase [Alphaproteobacteria bacterium]
MPEQFRVEIAPGQTVTAIEYPAAEQDRARITLILGHGAGAGQTSGFIVSFARALAERGIAVVTFNFLYIEQGRRLPDSGGKLETCYRAVIEAVRNRQRSSGDRLAIGGKSMGGRIASQVAAAGVGQLAGLVMLGYPLHPPGKPGQLRAKHLSIVRSAMLFVQGSRDAFGTPDEMRCVVEQLKSRADLYVVEGGDHSFKVLKSAGIRQPEVYRAVHDRIETWLRARIAD